MRISLILSLLLISSISQANGSWKSVNLRSTSGVEINVDYQYGGCQTYSADGRTDWQIRFAEPVWLNVRGISPGATVEVQIDFYEQSYIRRGSRPEPVYRDTRDYDRKITLTYAGEGRYTGQAGAMVIRRDSSSAYIGNRVQQKLKIIVNGNERALFDPISGGNEFQISLDDGRGC